MDTSTTNDNVKRVVAAHRAVADLIEQHPDFVHPFGEQVSA